MSHTRGMGLSDWWRVADGPLLYAMVTAGAVLGPSASQAQAPTEGPAEIVRPPVPTPRPPTPLERVQAEHEDEIAFCLERERSLSADAAGVVVIELRLDADGSPNETRVLSSTFAPGGVIDECVRIAVGRWTFPPPTELGEPAGSRVSLTFVLGLSSDTRAASAAPREVTVSWEVRAGMPISIRLSRLGVAEARTLIEEVGAGLALQRAPLQACFITAAAGRSTELQIDIVVPGGGDIGREDVTIVGRPPEGPELLRCIRPWVALVEARSTRGPVRVHWWVSTRTAR